ncbi:MAG: SH3 domain-containing protein [Parasporobacterium sp.]|nr:SH3 domain-containing protein [Parasporobacterium sp.]
MAGGYRKPKRKAGLGYLIILLIILIVFAAIGVFISRRFAPSKVYADLNAYYNMTAYGSDREAADANELAIIIDNKILDIDDTPAFRAVRSEGGVYIAMTLVQTYVDNRFYFDELERKVIVTNAVESVIADVDSTVYTKGGVQEDAGYIIATSIDGLIYLNTDFVQKFSSAQFKVQTNPDRLYVRNEWGTVKCSSTTGEVRMRKSANKKSDIVAVIPSGTELQIINENEEGWYKAADENGNIGYVEDKFITAPAEVVRNSDFTEPEYTHITLDGSVNMTWHGIYYFESNMYIDEYTADMKGVNVLAPTWFLFGDMAGNLISYVSSDYINYAHEHGWQVWAVLEDLDGLSSADVIPYSSSRANAISQMIEQCTTYGIDGINVDLEKVTQDIGDDFIQFIRELSAACRNNGLILSVCDYAPYSYNSFRRMDEQSRIADYVCVMAYDDYVGTNTPGPNAGLPFVEEVLTLCQDTVVDMNRLIVGIPLYSRIWYVNKEDNSVSADTIEMGDIEDLNWQYNLDLKWQEDVGYRYAAFETYDNSTGMLWYEDAKSIEAKLKLIKPFGVAGVATWRLGQETSDVWEKISNYY